MGAERGGHPFRGGPGQCRQLRRPGLRPLDLPHPRPRGVPRSPIKLFPGEVVLASTLEYVRIPRDVACDLKLKSTLGRLWINHSLAGWCDPGFQGEITLELQNLGPQPFVLEAGRRIAQLIFIAMESPPDVAYGDPGSSSHYQGQRGTTPARR